MAKSKEIQAGQPVSFEAAIATLETMVADLESDELPLQEAMQTFERSQELIKFCSQQLTEAEAKVQVLVSQLAAEGLSYDLEDFDEDEA